MIDWPQVQKTYNEVKDLAKTAQKHNIAVSTLYAAVNRGTFSFKKKDRFAKYNWNKIQKFYDNNHTITEIIDEFGCAVATVVRAVQQGRLKTRSRSDASQLRAQLKPRTHSEETKAKISRKRKKFLKENPDKVPYLLNHSSKGMSYPEQYFDTIFKERKLSVVYHYRVGTYELDFAIPEKKIDIEIDGEQHYSDDRIIRSDIKRTKCLESKGWTCLRIRWKDFSKLSFEERRIFIDNLIRKCSKSWVALGSYPS